MVGMGARNGWHTFRLSVIPCLRDGGGRGGLALPPFHGRRPFISLRYAERLHHGQGLTSGRNGDRRGRLLKPSLGSRLRSAGEVGAGPDLGGRACSAFLGTAGGQSRRFVWVHRAGTLWGACPDSQAGHRAGPLRASRRLDRRWLEQPLLAGLLAWDIASHFLCSMMESRPGWAIVLPVSSSLVVVLTRAATRAFTMARVPRDRRRAGSEPREPADRDPVSPPALLVLRRARSPFDSLLDPPGMAA
jgi:hypothetical protein